MNCTLKSFVFFAVNGPTNNRQQPLHMYLSRSSLETLCKCNECGKIFGNNRSLYSHRYNVHGPKINVQCPKCPKQFTTRKGIRNHIERHIAANLQCDICKKKFRLKKHIKYHMDNCHIRNRCHVCHICAAAFFDPIRFKMHIKRCENGDVGRRRRLDTAAAPRKRKIVTASGKVSTYYGCNFCAKYFHSLTTIMQHYDGEHADDGRTRLVCRYCNQLLESVDDVHEHISPTAHSLKCTLCPTTLRCVGRLDRHRLKHEKPHLCSVRFNLYIYK